MTEVKETKFVQAKTLDEKMNLISRNLAEVMGNADGSITAGKTTDQIRSIVQERDLRIYWGTATTGAPHIAYFVPMSKIADFLRAGCQVTILFADLHAYLDNMKSSWELLEHRTKYYENVIKGMLEAIGVPLEKLKFVRGTTFQLSKEYTLDMYRLSTQTNVNDAQRAGAEVVKQVQNPLLSGLLYPLLQALDEEYLKVDAQFGGVDQRKIFALASDFLPTIGYSKRIHLMNPMVPGLTGAKMSSSEKASKIDILDSAKDVEKKIKGAFCAPGEVKENGVLAFTKMVLFPLCNGKFTIDRKPENGGPVTYSTYQELEDAYAAQQLWPQDLKGAVTAYLNALLEPIRKKFSTPEMQELIRKAYPEKAEAAEAKAKAAEAPKGESRTAQRKAKRELKEAGGAAGGAGAGAGAAAVSAAGVARMKEEYVFLSNSDAELAMYNRSRGVDSPSPFAGGAAAAAAAGAGAGAGRASGLGLSAADSEEVKKKQEARKAKAATKAEAETKCDGETKAETKTEQPKKDKGDGKAGKGGKPEQSKAAESAKESAKKSDGKGKADEKQSGPAKKPNAAAANKGAAAGGAPQLDIRVGRIVKIAQHPDADSLYVEDIDVGEAEPRPVVSGLVKHVPIEKMQNRLVCVLCNLRKTKMRGQQSNAMVLAATGAEGQVELVDPPASAKVGERISFDGLGSLSGDIATPSEKAMKELLAGLQLDGKGNAAWNGAVFNTSAGPVRAAKLQSGRVG